MQPCCQWITRNTTLLILTLSILPWYWSKTNWSWGQQSLLVQKRREVMWLFLLNNKKTIILSQVWEWLSNEWYGSENHNSNWVTRSYNQQKNDFTSKRFLKEGILYQKKECFLYIDQTTPPSPRFCRFKLRIFLLTGAAQKSSKYGTGPNQ